MTGRPHEPGAVPPATSDEKAPEAAPIWFRRFARAVADVVGSPAAFVVAAASVGCWAATGPIFHYSDTWQLVVNTATTVVTFLMVFVIQHTQNRDARALHLKLDELIRGVRGARTELVALEEMSDAELDALDRQFKALRKAEERDSKPSEPVQPTE